MYRTQSANTGHVSRIDCTLTETDQWYRLAHDIAWPPNNRIFTLFWPTPLFIHYVPKCSWIWSLCRVGIAKHYEMWTSFIEPHNWHDAYVIQKSKYKKLENTDILNTKIIMFLCCSGWAREVHGNAVVWGTVVQAGRSRVRVLIMS
jgi:hypothetical protein